MTLISSLGLLAGVLLLVPKGVVVTVVLWGVAKLNPVLGAPLVWERGAAQTLLKTAAPLALVCNGRARPFANLLAEITLPAL